MLIRDRIKEFRRVKADTLRPNPRNWRKHPKEQADAMRAILAEIGYAGACLARELPDGSLELIDGHLRVETTPNQEIPVLVLDVTREEADKILATFDKLGTMAESDDEMLQKILDEVAFEDAAIHAMFKDIDALPEGVLDEEPADEPLIPEAYQVVVDCGSEAAQKLIYERLTQEGFKCRALTL